MPLFVVLKVEEVFSMHKVFGKVWAENMSHRNDHTQEICQADLAPAMYSASVF